MTAGKLAALGSSLVVLGAIVVGLIALGSPAQERLRRIDAQRVADLSQISTGLTRYYMRTNSIPTNLSEIVDGQVIRRLPTDPETEANYDYEIVNEDAYRLCAEFSAASEENRPDDFWAHSMGRHCFRFTPRRSR